MEENQEVKVDVTQQERFAVWERALQILREAIEECHLKDISEYKGDELLQSRWEMFKRELQGDFSIIILVSGLFGTLQWEFFLIKGVVHIIEEVDKLLRLPYADKLFAFSDEDNVDDIVNYHARSILMRYIYYLPVKMYQALNQTLDDSIRSHYKTVIEPTFKEHWKSLGLPSDFTVLPDSELHTYDKQIEDLRRIFVGDKRPKLTEEGLKQLAGQYQTLRSEYTEARHFHNQSRETFFKSNPSILDKDTAWRKAWSRMCPDMFPSLQIDCLELLADMNYLPNELATKHLARLHRYSDEYMRKLLRAPKKSKKNKKVKKQSARVKSK